MRFYDSGDLPSLPLQPPPVALGRRLILKLLTARLTRPLELDALAEMALRVRPAGKVAPVVHVVAEVLAVADGVAGAVVAAGVEEVGLVAHFGNSGSFFCLWRKGVLGRIDDGYV